MAEATDDRLRLLIERIERLEEEKGYSDLGVECEP